MAQTHEKEGLYSTTLNPPLPEEIDSLTTPGKQTPVNNNKKIVLINS